MLSHKWCIFHDGLSCAATTSSPDRQMFRSCSPCLFSVGWWRLLLIMATQGWGRSPQPVLSASASRGKGMVQWLYVNHQLLHNHHPKTQQLKTTCIYDVTISVDCSWVLQHSLSHKTAVKVLAGAAVISGLNWARTYFQVPSHGCWRGLLDWGPGATLISC